MHYLFAICVLLAAATEALSAPAVETAWFRAAEDTGNRVMYFVQTKQEMFVFNGVPPAVSAPPPSTGATAPTADPIVPSTSSDSLPWSTIPSAPALRLTTSAPIITSESVPTSTIPPGYAYYEATGSYYKIHKHQATWHVANATCASEGATLVMLNDEEEATIVAGIMNNSSSPYYYSTWTGHPNRAGESTTPGQHVLFSGIGLISWEGEWPPRGCIVFSAQQKQVYRFPCDSTWHFTCEISPWLDEN